MHGGTVGEIPSLNGSINIYWQTLGHTSTTPNDKDIIMMIKLYVDVGGDSL